MIPVQQLRNSPPTGLGQARALAHRAAQLLTMSARANLQPVPDDSHSNLGWNSETQSLVSHPLEVGGAQTHAMLCFNPLRLELTRNGQLTERIELDGISDSDARSWLDTQLVRIGLEAASKGVLPYDLPKDVANIMTYNTEGLGEQLASLTAWFNTAHQVLSDLASSLSEFRPGASPVRCWPHHFDIATYVGIEQGSAEAARGIGVGLSPGDESYNQPYFYVNPWPHLDPTKLPPAPAPGHWHVEGFVGVIATGEEILTLSDIQSQLPLFVENAFGIGRDQLGARV